MAIAATVESLERRCQQSCPRFINSMPGDGNATTVLSFARSRWANAI